MSVAIHTPEKTDAARRAKYFLPYQNRWVLDEGLFLIDEKSRRIGMTYAESYKKVRRCVQRKNWSVWFSSADESAAREFILYCETWAKVFNVVAENLGEVLLDPKDDIRAFVLEMPKTGARINALRSNPRAFRSKGGEVVLDEFAFHDDQPALWKAARPATTWGYPLTILSTHNGKQCLYYRILDEAKTKRARGERTPWAVHTTTLQDAVADGLADKILGRALTAAEREAWMQEIHDTCVDEETWQQEYCCIPVDEATAFLTYDLLATVEDALAGQPMLYSRGNVYIGMDLARRRDLSVIWVLEQVGDVLWTREQIAMKGASFSAQAAELDRVLTDYPTARRVCIDQTGMGEKFVEDLQALHGAGRVEGVLMTAPVKQELAFGLKKQIEDRTIRLPKQAQVRDDFHSVKKITTVAGNVRFDAERTDQGHADRFFAAALAVHAQDAGPPAAIATVESAWGRRDRFEERHRDLTGAGAGVGSVRQNWRERYGLFGAGSDREGLR